MLYLLRKQYLAVIWGLFILIICDAPMPHTGSMRFFEGFDKLAHTGFFFVLTVLLFFGSIKSHSKNSSHPVLTTVKIFIATAVFGAVIELLQLEIFTYRSAEWWDFFADMTGVCMGVFSYLFLYNTRSYEKAS